LTQIHFWRWPTDRVWIRDYGPHFLLGGDGKKAVLDWHFNAWAKYADWKNDDAIPARVAEQFQYRCWQPTRGDKTSRPRRRAASTATGQGLLLTTEECQLSDIQARNPELTREDLEGVFSHNIWVSKKRCGSIAASPATTRMAISTTWLDFVGVRTIVAVEENALRR
jgi:agmatine deiminase